MFLLPIIAGYSAYNLATTKSGDFEASGGDRKIDCYNIWEKIVTGPGTGSIQEGQAAATRLKAGYQDRLTTIDNLSKEMDAAWTGKSAEAAQQSGAHPLRVWMDDSGKKLVDSDKYLGEQNTAFTTVKAKVQQVPKDPPKNNLLNSITPWTTDTDRAIRDYNSKGQANVDAFNEYFKASSENGKGLPTYNKMEGQKSDIDVNGGDGGKDKDGGGQGDRNGNNGMPGISTPPGSMPPGSMPPGGMPNVPGSNMPGIGGPGSNLPGANLPGSNMPGIGGPGSNMPGANLPGGQYNPNLPGSNYKPPAWDDGTNASGFTPPKIPGAGGFGPGGDGGGGAGFGGTDIPGAGGFGPDGGFGPGGGAGFGPGGGSGAAMPGNAGAMGGAGMGGGAGGSGSGAGRGAGGMMGGMGGMGAGGAKGKGGEDEERSSKFLVGDDPNEIFGTDELTAPPVIGE